MSEPFGGTEKEEFSEETAIRQMIDGITDCLASMTKEERLAWFRMIMTPTIHIMSGCGREQYEQSARKNNSFILPFKP